MSDRVGLAEGSRNPRFELFDGLRAIAATAVLVGHTAAQAHTENSWIGVYTARLNVGVTLFFVISGFLLYRPFVASRSSGLRGVALRDYARRRALRILPAYWVALTCLALFPGLVGVFSNDFWRYYGLLQIYDERTFLAGLPPAWTLAVELSFYALLPLYAMAIAAAGRRFAATRTDTLDLTLLGTLAVISVAFRTWILVRGGNPIPAFWISGQFDWFAIGMALAVLHVRHAGKATRPRWISFVEEHPLAVWAGAALAYWALCTRVGLPPLERFHVPAYFGVRQFLGQHVLSGVVAALLVLPAVFGGRAGGLPRRLLATPVFVFVGTISYGIFLWHDPLIYELSARGALTWLPNPPILHVPFLVITIATMTVGIICGTASWYLIERPALMLKRRYAPPHTQRDLQRAGATDREG